MQNESESQRASGPFEAPADAPRGLTPGQRQTLLITAVAGHAIKHIMASAFFILLPEMKAGLGLNNSQVGALSTARLAAGGIANFPAGYVADRFTKLRAIVLGASIAGIGVTYFLAGISTTFWVVTLWTSLMVVSISLWHPAAIGSLARQFTAERGKAISLHGAGGSVGEAVGPLAAGFLLGYLTWEFIFQGALIPSIVLGFIIWLILRRVPAEIGESMTFSAYASGVASLLSSPRMLLVLLFAGGFAGAQAVVLTFMPIYARETLDVSTETVGFYLFLLNIPGIVSQPVMGIVSDKFGRRAVIVPALIVLAITNYLLSVVPAGPLFFATVLVMGLFVYSLMAIFLAAASDLAPGDVQATTVSLVFGVATGVGAFAPLAGGWLADNYSLEAAFVGSAVLVALTAFVAMVTRWERRPEKVPVGA